MAESYPEAGMKFSTIQNDQVSESSNQRKSISNLHINEDEVPKDNKTRITNRLLKNAEYKKNSQSMLALNKEEQRKHR